MRSRQPQTHRRILSLAQDIIYASSKGSFTPKHIALAVTVKHLTGSKELIRVLNRFGHCVSYDEVAKYETQCIEHLLLDTSENEVMIPSNISAGTFVQAAADNLDFSEETLDGKNTTHITTLVLYQRAVGGTFGSNIPMKKSTKRKPLSELPVSKNILTFSKQCRKLNVPSTLFQSESVKDSLDESNQKKMSVNLDMAWVFSRVCPSKPFSVTLQPLEKQRVPGWSAFNAIVSANESAVTNVGYCPCIPSTPTEYSTVYTVMKTVQKMMKRLNQKHSVITFDEAIYCKAKEVQWRCKDEFSNTVLRLGGFHTALTFMAVIGKRYEESGLEDLLIESDLYGSQTVSRILKGKTYNKGVRAFKLVMEALCRIRLSALSAEITDKSVFDNYLDLISQLQKAIVSEDQASCTRILTAIGQESDTILYHLNEFRRRSRTVSDTFAFWDDFISMVEILLRFVRAERDGLWELHLEAVSEMLPYFFAYDRINYARWATIYYSDMKSLADKAPEVFEEFVAGNHPVKRATGSFNQVWTDLALEQSINRDSKTHGGLIGNTRSDSAMNRWLLTSHFRADIVATTKKMCCMSEVTDSCKMHKEAGPSRVSRDETDVQKLVNVFQDQLLNPFLADDHKTDLVMNLASGMTSTNEISKDLTSALSVGETRLKEFIEKRLIEGHGQSPLETIPKQKLKTLGHLKTPVKLTAVSESKQSVNVDRAFFSRMLVVSKSRDVKLKEILSYELTPVPYALAHADGSLRKTSKCNLMHLLEDEVTVSETLSSSVEPTAWIIDGMALVQKNKPTTESNFGEYACTLFKSVVTPFRRNECTRIDVVFDRYDVKNSIKGSERERRRQTEGIYINIHGPQTHLPKQWPKFLDDPRNKGNLADFLSTHWCEIGSDHIPDGKILYLAGGFEDGLKSVCISNRGVAPVQDLFCNQEEADTRMLLHAEDCMLTCNRVVVESPDTDVAILCIYFFGHLRDIKELHFYTGVADKLRFVPIHSISDKLGPSLTSLLLPFHALTGCDTTSSVGRLGKVKPWKLLKECPTSYQNLALLGSSLQVSEATMAVAEHFICNSYCQTENHSKVNDLRYSMFCKRFAKTEQLPPTANSFQQHVLRANFQAYIWKTALEPMPEIPKPFTHGWQKSGEILKATLMTNECAPKSLVSVVSCSCNKSKCTDRCSCRSEGVPCIESCSCGTEDECQNPFKKSSSLTSEMNDSDEEDASSDEEN